jgi:hypothetical protein
MPYETESLPNEPRTRNLWQSLPGLLADGTTVLVVASLMVSLVSLYGGHDAASGSLVVKCDEAASAAANRSHRSGGSERDWRRDRWAAFQRCIDGSLGDSRDLRPQRLTKRN